MATEKQATTRQTAEQQDRRFGEQQARQEGAQEAATSVAEAVKRVADAAVAAAANVQSGPAPEFYVTGSVGGGGFSLVGDGFRSSGIVMLNGTQVPTTMWSNQRIEGTFPQGAQYGEVVVRIDNETEKRAYFGPKPATPAR